MPGTVLDVFNTDAFGLISLTDSINKAPFVPSRIGAMGLFAAVGVAQNTIAIEEQEGILSLLVTKQRGEKGTQARGTKRTVRSFAIPHIPYEEAVLAEQVQGVRAFGFVDVAKGAAQVVNDRLIQMRQDHEVTLEYHRIGALQGVIKDGDGETELHNLFTDFDVSEQSVTFALATATTDIRAKCLAVIRKTENAMGVALYDHVHAFCGATWFEAFIGHEYVKDAYHRFQDSFNLRNDPRKGFEFGGITFEEYRGKIGDVDFFPANEARFFPVGVPGLFKTYYGPADFIETVNTLGQPLYAKQEPMEFDRGILIHTQSNPLSLCLRPRSLVKGLA